MNKIKIFLKIFLKYFVSTLIVLLLILLLVPLFIEHGFNFIEIFTIIITFEFVDDNFIESSLFAVGMSMFSSLGIAWLTMNIYHSQN